MARRPHGRAAWVVPAICAALIAAGLTAETRVRTGQLWQPDTLVVVLLGLGFTLVGALIAAQRPRHRLARLFLASGSAMALTVPLFEYAWYGLVTRPGALPGALAAAWVSSWLWTLGFTPLFTFGLLLFPDGHLPSRRWRWAALIDALAVLCLLVPAAFLPGQLANHPVPNPLGLGPAVDALQVAGTLALPLVLAGIVLGVGALAVRWRRADPGGRARRQVSLLLLASGVSFVGLSLSEVMPGSAGVALASAVAVVLVPSAIGVAVLRHRLYDIDVVLNRSLVYAGLTAAISASYAGLVWSLGAPLTQGTWRSGVAVGIIGALVLPLRTGVQRLVDASMYGDRGDPPAALSRLTARLQAAAAPGAALPAVAEAIADSLRLPHVVIETTTGDGAAAGQPAGGPAEALPLLHQGQQVGRLVVEGRDRRPLGARDTRLLAELARPAGAAVSAAALADALTTSRARLVRAREEERRRLRRDLHDGLGPTLAGIGLGLDLVTAGLDDDPTTARRTIQELKLETMAAVDDVRRLVQDLRPPALDELGLVPAIRQQAERLALRSPGLVMRVDAAGALPPLPAATEVAAYRIAVEAVTNSVRHARARTCRVAVAADGVLRVEVVDDGHGIPSGTVRGVGLSAMEERAAEVGGVCTVEPGAADGTRVVALLPLATA